MNSTRELPAEYLENCPVIDERYKVLFKLGSGRFSKVRMAICLTTNQRVAIKIINQKENQQSKFKQYDSRVVKSFLDEIQMCVKSKHKNIIKIIDFQVGGVYRSPDGRVRRIIYYVMKIATNGQLHRLIKQTDTFSEKFARFLFRQLISAVQHLHNSRISHMDIKAENILIDEKINLRLADFGCSNYFLDYEHNKIEFDPSEPVGSLKSNAPQITNAEKQGIYHGDELDLFACGYVLFEMVMKAQPFKSSDHKDPHYSQLMQEDTQEFWNIFSTTCDPSEQFKDLVERLFDPNPKTRISLQTLKKHPWYTGQIPKKNQYKKQMNTRLKKVWAKVRKQQEEQIKAFFKKQRSQIKCGKLEETRVIRQFESQILNLHQLIQVKDNSDSSSGMSNADAKDQLSSTMSYEQKTPSMITDKEKATTIQERQRVSQNKQWF